MLKIEITYLKIGAKLQRRARLPQPLRNIEAF
jgi:hypothetical protein